MKIETQNKKGLTTTLSIIIDKKIIQQELDKKLIELQSEVSLKGFRPGKVPANVIKSQFGKISLLTFFNLILLDLFHFFSNSL